MGRIGLHIAGWGAPVWRNRADWISTSVCWGRELIAVKPVVAVPRLGAGAGVHLARHFLCALGVPARITPRRSGCRGTIRHRAPSQPRADGAFPPRSNTVLRTLPAFQESLSARNHPWSAGTHNRCQSARPLAPSHAGRNRVSMLPLIGAGGTGALARAKRTPESGH